MKSIREVGRRVVEHARKLGAQHADALVVDGRQQQVKVNQGEVDFFKEAQTSGVGLRVLVDERLGFVHSADFRPDALRHLAERAVVLARHAQPDRDIALPDGDCMATDANTDLDLFDAEIAEMTGEEQIRLALEMEAAALAIDPRVQRTQTTQVSRVAGVRVLVSSNGAELAYDSTALALHVCALASDSDSRQMGWSEGGVWRHLGQAPEPTTLGETAARQALRRLGPRQIASQRLPVVMHPRIAAEWVEHFVTAFSGEEVLKKTSYLSEKRGERIASPLVTLVDDAMRPGGVASEPFDGEGVAPRTTLLIDAGVCSSFLYDFATARRAHTQPTGSARRDYDRIPSIAPHNLHIVPGETSFEELLHGCKRGFYYVDSGAFGYNPTTGDYSFQAAGFWIEDGELAFPVDGITVASNTLAMLQNVDAVGREMEWRGSTSSPALRIREMTVGR